MEFVGAKRCYSLVSIYDRLIPENMLDYLHVLEGSDDMPAHAKCIITGVSINIPITDGRLNLGTWQGIYLCEFRNNGGSRRIVATILEIGRASCRERV